MSLERFLQGMELAVGRGESLDGRDGRTLRLDRKREARASGLAVDENRAATADAVLAADVRARETEGMAQDIGEKPSCLDVNLVGDRVDGQLDASALARLQGHYDPSRAYAFAAARRAAFTPSLRAK
jgi:hypothetical protein